MEWWWLLLTMLMVVLMLSCRFGVSPVPTPQAVAHGGGSQCCGGGHHHVLLPVVRCLPFHPCRCCCGASKALHPQMTVAVVWACILSSQLVLRWSSWWRGCGSGGGRCASSGGGSRVKKEGGRTALTMVVDHST
jgi:hypothetical protein